MAEPKIILIIGFDSEKQIEQYMVDLCEAGLANIPQFQFKGVGPEFLERVNERVKYEPTMPAPVELKSTIIHVDDKCTILESDEGAYSQKYRIPEQWAAIPLEFIEKDESKEIEEIQNWYETVWKKEIKDKIGNQ